ncbi:MAG: M1 family metallopeptidase [Firmicutes bacterium]|nr:M1 family metallopeptidase [Bacillota bacterium]
MKLSTKKVKQAAIFCVLFTLVALALGAFFACTPKEQTRNSLYTIVAEFDENLNQIDAVLTLDFVNNSDQEMTQLMLHLYPRAYRNNAKHPALSPLERTTAFASQNPSFGDMTIFSVLLNLSPMPIVLGGQDQDMLIVCFNGKILKPNQSVKIEIDFRVTLATVRHRLGVFEGVANLGNWFPIASVFEDGQFNTHPYYWHGDPFYSLAADFCVTIKTAPGLTVATSGKSQTRHEDGKKITTAKIQNARDFAAAIAPFNTTIQTHNDIEISFYYINHHNPHAVLDLAFLAIETFDNLFGAYPFNSLAIVKTPFLHGGMEYPALIFVSDALSGDFFNEVVVHEIAHQWWYGAVHNNQITEAWVDEGLAEYSTTLFYEKNPQFGVTRQQRIASAWQNYVLFVDLHKDGGRGNTSMNRALFDFASGLEYSVLVYTKGQLMFDTLRSIIGDSDFFGGLKKFYADFKFKTATGDGLINAFESVSQVPLNGFFNSWLNGNIITPR